MSRQSKNPRFSATVPKLRASGHAVNRSRVPRLHALDLSDDSRVLGAIDALLMADDNYKLMSSRILAAHDRLQQLCDSDACLAFFDVEQLPTARVNMMFAAVARWAVNEGHRPRLSDRASRC